LVSYKKAFIKILFEETVKKTPLSREDSQ
jgi:hypothetical protein